MGTFSIWHWIIVLVIVLLLFGANKIPRLMGDVAKGVKEFKKGLKDEDDPAASASSPAASPKSLEGGTTATPRADETVKRDHA